MTTASDKTRVLVVDDEPGIREGCRNALVLEGYEVDVAEDGLAGYEAVKSGPGYAVALVDLMMPGMGGLELLAKAREIDPDLVVFIITAYATIETAVDATRKGAYGYIPKPFTPDELLVPIRRAAETRALAIETRRLRAEREGRLLEVALERSRSNTIIKCMTDAVVAVNRDRQVVLVNDAAKRALGASITTPVAFDSLGLPEELTGPIDECLASTGGRLIISCEAAIGDKTFAANVSPIVDDGAGSLGAVAVLRDISDAKKLDKAKITFIGMVAHEVRRPLGVIVGYLNLLLDDAAGLDESKRIEITQRARDRGQALQTMVGELMNITAMKTGKFVLKRAPVKMAALLRRAVEAAGEKAAERSIKIMLDIPAGVESGDAFADENAVATIFSNLLDNAIKYGREGGNVFVSMAEWEDVVAVSFRDDGVGMSDDAKARAGEEFFREIRPETSAVTGTGLGLSVVKRLLDMHHGRLVVESMRGVGSVFTVEIPK